MTSKVEAQWSWQHAVAGCTAGLTSVLLLHPLDVVRTRLQVQDGMAGALPVYRGVRHAVRTMVAQEGWRSLYSGLSPALLGAGLSWGLYFVAYNAAKQRYQRSRPGAKLPPQLHLLSAAQAGCVVCCITNPVWVIKTRLQLQRSGARALAAATRSAVSTQPAYRGFLHAARTIAQEEGLRGFYRGLGPSLLLVSHGAIQFAVYEELKAFAANAGPGRPRDNISSAEITAIGAVSKLAASIATYPSQVIRSRLQQRLDPGRARWYRSGWAVLRTTLRREGAAGLYRGLLPNVLRVMPQSAITFLAYEKTLQLLQGLAARHQPPAGHRGL